jgi:hypothetical protein
LLLAAKGPRERALFFVSTVACYAAINLPFIIAKPSLWFSFWQFHADWYIEGSWMLAFLPDFSPLRHYIFPALLLSLYAAISWISAKKTKDAVTLAWLSTFAFLFSTYVFTPQMNLILLPLFAVTPIVKRYWEFLAFEMINLMFVFPGFPQLLFSFGVPDPYRWLVVVRSVWLGKILVFDGLLPFVARRRGTVQERPVLAGSS